MRERPRQLSMFPWFASSLVEQELGQTRKFVETRLNLSYLLRMPSSRWRDQIFWLGWIRFELGCTDVALAKVIAFTFLTDGRVRLSQQLALATGSRTVTSDRTVYTMLTLTVSFIIWSFGIKLRDRTMRNEVLMKANMKITSYWDHYNLTESVEL